MTFDISWLLTFHDLWHFMTFDIWHFMTFDISWHLTFHDIWHFMTFAISWHLTFHDIWHFMTFDISWHLTFHVIWHFLSLSIKHHKNCECCPVHCSVTINCQVTKIVIISRFSSVSIVISVSNVTSPYDCTFRDLWHLRHWLQYWQLRTWINDNLCYLTINCDIGQHSQFLRCFPMKSFWPQVLKTRFLLWKHCIFESQVSRIAPLGCSLMEVQR